MPTPPHHHNRGQMVTWLILFIALGVLMGVMMTNLGQVTAVRTRNTVAAITSVLPVTSSVGGLSRQLWKLNGKSTYRCKVNWRLIVTFIIAIILIVITWGAATPFAIAMLVILVVTVIVQGFVIMPIVHGRINEQLKGLDLRTRLKEQAIFGAFLASVDDPIRVRDDGTGYDPGFKDDIAKDLDRDGDTTEFVSRFAAAYSKRLSHLYEPVDGPTWNNFRSQVRGVIEKIKEQRERVSKYVDPTAPDGYFKTSQPSAQRRLESWEYFLDSTEGSGSPDPATAGKGYQLFFWVEDEQRELSDPPCGKLEKAWDKDIPNPHYIHYNAKTEKYCPTPFADPPPPPNTCEDHSEIVSCGATDFNNFVIDLEEELGRQDPLTGQEPGMDNLARTTREWLDNMVRSFWLKEFDQWKGKFWDPAKGELQTAKARINVRGLATRGLFGCWQNPEHCFAWECNPPPPAWLTCPAAMSDLEFTRYSGCSCGTCVKLEDKDGDGIPETPTTIPMMKKGGLPAHPIDCFIAYTQNKYVNPITEWDPGELSPPRPNTSPTNRPFYRLSNPVYSWQDRKGRWHHVRVTIGDFDLPELEVVYDDTGIGLRLNIFVSCVMLNNAEGSIPLTVARYDQDQLITRFWTMRARANPEDETFDASPAITAQRQQADGKPWLYANPDAEIGKGIAGCAEARWSYDPYPGAWLTRQKCN